MARYGNFKQYNIATRELAALAFAAQRVNGTLHKDDRFYDKDKDAIIEVVPNKVLMRNSFAFEPGSNPELVVTEQDHKDADAAIEAIQQDVMVKKLADRRVSDFVFTMAETLSKETLTQRDCGLMAFLPSTYQRMLDTRAKQEATETISYTSEYIGQVGDKIQLDFTMIDNRYLQQYNCYSVTGTDSNSNMVNFLTAHQSLAKSGRIQGKVKRQDKSSYHNGAKVTQLNFVKAI